MRCMTAIGPCSRSRERRGSECACPGGNLWITRTAAALLSSGLLWMGLAPPAASAVSAAGAIGYERFTGVRGHVAQGGLAVLAVAGSRASAFVQGVRYDDSFVGRGTSATLGGTVPCAGPVALRAQATRFFGDGYGAWRFLGGPELRFPEGSSVALLGTRFQDRNGFESTGAQAEAGVSLAPRWTARASLAYAVSRRDAESGSGGERSAQGSLGAIWRALRNLELSAEMGLARRRLSAAGPFPSAPPVGGLSLVGGDPSAASGTGSTDDEVAPTALVGVRVLIP